MYLVKEVYVRLYATANHCKETMYGQSNSTITLDPDSPRKVTVKVIQILGGRRPVWDTYIFPHFKLQPSCGCPPPLNKKESVGWLAFPAVPAVFLLFI